MHTPFLYRLMCSHPQIWPSITTTLRGCGTAGCQCTLAEPVKAEKTQRSRRSRTGPLIQLNESCEVNRTCLAEQGRGAGTARKTKRNAHVWIKESSANAHPPTIETNTSSCAIQEALQKKLAFCASIFITALVSADSIKFCSTF